MNNYQLPLNGAQREYQGNRLAAFLHKKVVVEKLYNPFGIGFLLVCAGLIAFLVGQFGLIAGLAVIGVIAGIPTLYAIVAYPKFGMIVLLVFAYVLIFLLRLGANFPLGTVMDGLQALLILGFYIRQKYEPRWSIYNNQITIIILIWIFYNILEVLNPVAASQMAWMYTIRSVAFVMLMYFIFMYHLRTIAFIKLLFKIWLGLSVVAALYGLKQEFIGFADFEQEGLNDPLVQSLLFIDGHWRKFSIFSDPVSFSYNMVASSMLCIGLIFGPISNLKRIVLGCLVMLFFSAMLYSGTRGAYVLFPAALVLLGILKFNRKVLVLAILGGMLFSALLVVPTSSPTLYRFQSAFRPSNDASFNVRKVNQKRIQPYILSHPMGGGLGATGAWGQRFSPNSYLANFPPDSGYVRVAVELGWIGLLIYCAFMFIVLKVGIENYYKIRNEQLKSFCLAMVLIAFSLNIGNYPQEAFVQFPISIYFYLVVALINVTKLIDDELEAKQLQTTATLANPAKGK